MQKITTGFRQFFVFNWINFNLEKKLRQCKNCNDRKSLPLAREVDLSVAKRRKESKSNLDLITLFL